MGFCDFEEDEMRRGVQVGLGVLGCVVAMMGCEQKESVEAPKTEAPAPEVPSAVPPKSEPEAAEAPAGARAPEAPAEDEVDVARAEEVVKRWVEAQNSGDFDAYQAQYAERFSGIKRVGASVSSYDREGWLKDRKRMFQKKMEVSATDIEIEPASRMAVVRFTQSWASGSYKDVGPKQLVLVPQGEKGPLQIVREEMITSQIEGAGEKGAAPAAGAVGFYTVADDAALLILPIAAEETWFQPKTVRGITRSKSAIADAVVSNLPAEVRALQGKEVAFFGPRGESCRGKITGFGVRAEVTPHFGAVQTWDGMWEDDTNKDRRSDAYVAEAIMELGANGGRYVVAKTDIAASTCGEPSWGSVDASSSAAAAPFSPVTDASLKGKMTSAFKALPGYTSNQAHYESSGTWLDSSDAVTTLTQASLGDRRFVYMDARAGRGCGDFYGEFWALWEVKGDDLVLLSDGKEGGEPPALRAVIDLGSDGKPEFVGTSKVLAAQGPVWRNVASYDVPMFDCPC